MILFFFGGAFMLGLCIIIHELGHYLLGRLVGIRAEVFSIGYGRGIWKKKIGDTTWQITAIPIGGYVKFYGDDYQDRNKQDRDKQDRDKQDRDKAEPGGLLDAHPLRRIVPVLGGPLFNLILGFLIFFLVHSISGPLSPRIHIQEEYEKGAPAYRAGLRNGDLVTKINGEQIRSFLDIQQKVHLASGEVLNFEIERKGEKKSFKIKPEVTSSGIALIGIRRPGVRNIEVSYPNLAMWSHKVNSLIKEEQAGPALRAYPYLQDGDVILDINGKKIPSVQELKRILGVNHGKEVDIRVRRKTIPWLSGLFTKEVTVRTPTYGEYRVNFRNIKDLKYKTTIPDMSLESNVPTVQRGLYLLRLNGQSVGNFQNIFSRFEKSRRVRVQVGSRMFMANVQAVKTGTLGFMPRQRIKSEYTESAPSIAGAFIAASRDTWNNIRVYPEFIGKLLSGRMSFLDNAVGPVGMFAIAGKIVEEGYRDYLKLIAFISIALMVMNLLPIPVVDGGHIVFFLYEAIAGKAISLRIMEMMHFVSMSGLILLGVVIVYQDILRFVIQ